LEKFVCWRKEPQIPYVQTLLYLQCVWFNVRDARCIKEAGMKVIFFRALQDLDILISIMEHFVKRFILKDEARKLKKSIPPRPKQSPPEDRERQAQLIVFPPPKPSKTP
jgi:hypothetical protein